MRQRAVGEGAPQQADQQHRRRRHPHEDRRRFRQHLTEVVEADQQGDHQQLVLTTWPSIQAPDDQHGGQQQRTDQLGFPTRPPSEGQRTSRETHDRRVGSQHHRGHPIAAAGPPPAQPAGEHRGGEARGGDRVAAGAQQRQPIRGVADEHRGQRTTQRAHGAQHHRRQHQRGQPIGQRLPAAVELIRVRGVAARPAPDRQPGPQPQGDQHRQPEHEHRAEPGLPIPGVRVADRFPDSPPQVQRGQHQRDGQQHRLRHRLGRPVPQPLGHRGAELRRGVTSHQQRGDRQRVHHRQHQRHHGDPLVVAVVDVPTHRYQEAQTDQQPQKRELPGGKAGPPADHHQHRHPQQAGRHRDGVHGEQRQQGAEQQPDGDQPQVWTHMQGRGQAGGQRQADQPGEHGHGARTDRHEAVDDHQRLPLA